jgi:sugar (pentulose or hexulose) kinase
MPKRLGWTEKMAPLHSASDRWPVRPELARRLGLDASTQVLCGLHDSSASLLPHLKRRQPPFTIVSTGTWVILFAVGGDIERLDPARDTLANNTVYGEPVPVGRFMGGREFDLLTQGDPAVASDIDVARVLAERIMALPTFVSGVGPFPAAKGQWTADRSRLSAGERHAAASLYLALVTAESIRCASGSGPVVIEGPFARNRLFCSALSAIGGYAVEPSETSTGTTLGAALLATGRVPKRATENPVAPLAHPALARYVEEWRRAAV